MLVTTLWRTRFYVCIVLILVVNRSFTPIQLRLGAKIDRQKKEHTVLFSVFPYVWNGLRGQLSRLNMDIVKQCHLSHISQNATIPKGDHRMGNGFLWNSYFSPLHYMMKRHITFSRPPVAILFVVSPVLVGHNWVRIVVSPAWTTN